MLTKTELEVAARALWDEAHAADPIRTEENARAVLGDKISESGVFVWSRLTVPELPSDVPSLAWFWKRVASALVSP